MPTNTTTSKTPDLTRATTRSGFPSVGDVFAHNLCFMRCQYVRPHPVQMLAQDINQTLSVYAQNQDAVFRAAL
jgi:hypothetical protein